jgi:hypothetical protein
MGPFIMAGLTHDVRGIQLPTHDNDLLPLFVLPDDIGHVSIFGLDNEIRTVCNTINSTCTFEQVDMAIFSGRAHFLKIDKRHVVVTSNISNSGEGLDATFRVTTPYSR